MDTIYKYKTWEIKFFIYEWSVRKWEIIGMTTYIKKQFWEETQMNLYFIQTSNIKVNSDNIIFQRSEDSIYDTKLECFKKMDKTNL